MISDVTSDGGAAGVASAGAAAPGATPGTARPSSTTSGMCCSVMASCAGPRRLVIPNASPSASLICSTSSDASGAAPNS
eukprot:6305911-Pyramimonas_sp.AAC.2